MDSKKYFSALKKAALFKEFSESEFSDLESSNLYRICEYAKDDIIFSEDEECTALSIVLEGLVEIQKIDVLGKILSIVQLTPGHTFGEVLIFSDKSSFPMTVVAKSYTVVLHLKKDQVIELCRNNSKFLSAYLRLISNKALTLNLKLKEVTLKTIRQKICDFILQQYKNQKNLNIRLYITKKDWADKIGVQRPSLSRELIKMKDEGIIDFNKNTIIIKDLSAISESLE